MDEAETTIEETLADATDNGGDDGQAADQNDDGSKGNDREGWAPVARVQELAAERNRYRDESSLQSEKIEWLQEQLLARQHQPQPQEDPSVDTAPLYEELKQAIDEGRGADAANVQRQLAEAQQSNFEKQMDSRLEDSSKRVAKRVTDEQGERDFQKALKQTLIDRPEFDDSSPTYDRAVTAKVLRVMRGLHADGTDKVTAMEEAIDLVVGDKPSLDFDERTAAQRKTNAKQSREKAPGMTTQSNRVHSEATVDVTEMTREQFDAFRKDKKAYNAARGD